MTVDSAFAKTTGTVLVRQSKSEDARDVGRRFAPLWRVSVQNLAPTEFASGSFGRNLFAPPLKLKNFGTLFCDGRFSALRPLAALWGVLLWWQMVVALCLSCSLAPCQDLGQPGERGPYLDVGTCTDAAHSFDFAPCRGTYRVWMAGYGQSEEPDLCCEKDFTL